MIEDALRPLRKRAGAALRRVPGGRALLALKPRHTPQRQLCDMLAATPDDAPAQEHLRAFGNLTPPADLAAIYAEMRAMTHPARRDRLVRLTQSWPRGAAGSFPRFTHHRLSSHADLFLAARPSASALVCFPDYWTQMFMPFSRFMAQLGADAIPPVHLVVLRGPARGAYCRGIPGLGHSLGQTVAALRTRLADFGVVHRAYLGASLGGFFALRAALHDPGTASVALAGRFFRAGGAIHLGEVGSAYDALLCPARARGQLHCLYGDGAEIDRRHAERLAAANPSVTLHPIANVPRHDPVAALVGRRQWTTVLTRIVALAQPAPPQFSLP